MDKMQKMAEHENYKITPNTAKGEKEGRRIIILG